MARLAFAGIPVHGAEKHKNVTRELFMPATEGYISAGTLSVYGRYAVVDGNPDADAPSVHLTFKVPDDFVSFTSVKAVWLSAATSGNMYWQLVAQYGAAGETHDTHAEDPSLGTTATGGTNIINVQEPANPLTLASLAAGDYLGIKFYRNGTNDLDTLDTLVSLLGLLFTYIAEQ